MKVQNTCTMDATELTQRANQASEQNANERKQRFEERNARLEPHLEADAKHLIQLYQSDEMAAIIEAAADKGYDSVVLKGSEYYNPGNTFADASTMYHTLEGEEGGIPYATLRRGIYNRRTRVSNPSHLPGGRTSVQRFAEFLQTNNGLYVVQRNRDSKVTNEEGQTRRVLQWVIDIVWDLEKYETRTARIEERRQARRAEWRARREAKLS